MPDKRVNLSLSPEDANHVMDALSYYTMAAENNFGSGYERGSDADDEQRRTWRAVKKIETRLWAKLEIINYI